MYGGQVGSLNVFINTNYSEVSIWSQTGNQGDKWMFGQVSIRKKEPYKVRKENGEVIVLLSHI